MALGIKETYLKWQDMKQEICRPKSSAMGIFDFLLIRQHFSADKIRHPNVRSRGSYRFRLLTGLIFEISSFFLTRKNIEIVFISRPVHLFRDTQRGLYDRVLRGAQKFYGGTCGAWFCIGLTPINFISPSNPAPLPFFQSFKRIFQIYFSFRHMFISDDDVGAKLFGEGTREFLTKKRVMRISELYFRFFFGFFNKVKVVFIASYATEEALGLIKSAEACGVTVVDVQHGKQGKWSLNYDDRIVGNFQNEIPLKSLIGFCWNAISRQRLIESGLFSNAFVVGSPHNSPQFQPKKSKCVGITLGFSCQVPQAHIKRRVPELIRLLAAQKDITLVVRPHPNDLEFFYNFEGGADITLNDPSSSISEFLTDIDIHVTHYSSVSYDALEFGVPTYLVGSDALDIFAEEIKAGVFHWIDIEAVTPESFAKIVRSRVDEQPISVLNDGGFPDQSELLL